MYPILIDNEGRLLSNTPSPAPQVVPSSEPVSMDDIAKIAALEAAKASTKKL